MAASTSNAEHKTALIEMAEAWETLARDRIEHLRRQARIAALEKSAKTPDLRAAAGIDCDAVGTANKRP
jgi:hypothetical protein